MLATKAHFMLSSSNTQSNLYKNWRQFLVHTNEYFEYSLKDLGYLGEEMFVMIHLGKRELVHGMTRM
jgi:hypothetical protein